jgi:capsular exopolysaccharide synthesis family protein
MFAGKKTDTEESSLPIINEDQNQESSSVAFTPEEKERIDRYTGILLSELDVEQVERTNLVNVQVRSTNPELAAKVADTVAQVFIEKDTERETEGAKKAYEDISKSIDDLKATIETQQQSLNNLQKNIDNPLMGEQGAEFNAAKLQQLSTQLFEAQDTRRKLEAEYAASQRANANDEILSVQGNNQAVQEMRKQLAERKAKLDDRIQEIKKQLQEKSTEKSKLLARYTEEYKDVKQVNEEISKLESILATTEQQYAQSSKVEEKELKQKVAKEVLTGLAAQLAAARKRESQIQAVYSAEEARANRQGLAATNLTTRIREIETNRKLLDDYIQLQKQRELEITTTSPDNVKISMRAQTPTSPIGPQRNRNIFVAFLISLVAGMGLAFLLDYLDDSVRTSDDVGRNLALPTLALIPYQSGGERRKLLLGAKNGNGAGASTALITLEDNRSPMAEAYRHLRTSLLFSSAGKPPQTILVTSSQPAEGKTTTAINTAITLAQSGAEVVIIDCDLRRPRLHNHFGLENIKGLTNYLSGDKNPSNMLNSYPKLPNLKIITSGPIPPNPAELLSSNEMKNLLQFLRGNFKHVIIDSPPAISFTDAAILSTLVDGVVLVAMAGKSSIHLMRRFKQRLANIGARIYGVVLNGIKSNSVEYGYYGYSYSNYYAASNDDDSTPLLEDVEEYEEVASIHDTNP